MPARTADARWEGSITEGKGTMRLGSGAFEGPYSFQSRFEEGAGTNPEELIGAAHAGCYSMQLSALLTRAGSPPNSIATTASVYLEKAEGGFRIPRIDLRTEVEVPGMDEATFQEHAEKAKSACPVSQALGGVDTINLEAKLLG